MPYSLAVLLAVLRSVVRSRAELQLENLALRQQINVLRRSLEKRPKLSSGDRLFWVSLSRLWRDWPSTLSHRETGNRRGLASLSARLA
jgi:hypothetical protein